MVNRKKPVGFQRLPSLPSMLQTDPRLSLLLKKINSIDKEIEAPESREKKLEVVRQTGAIHYATIKLTLEIVKAQESKESPNKKMWQEMLVAVANRGRELSTRDNVREHFEHWQKPAVLRILLHDGKIHRTALVHRAQTVGIGQRDKRDIEWVIEHWEIVKTFVEIAQPPEELITVEQCEKHLAWLESALRVAAGDSTPQHGLGTSL